VTLRFTPDNHTFSAPIDMSQTRQSRKSSHFLASLLFWRIRHANCFDHAIAVTAQLVGLCSMDWPDYLRDQAAKYRQLAEQTDDPAVKNELLELASVCEEVASNIEDHLTGG
jgi:hypothetical protein